MEKEQTTAKLLKIKELAEMLSVSPRTIMNMMKEDKIPYMKIGRCVRFDPNKIEQWLSTLTIKIIKDSH